jgi:site-specific DNA-cytosine methylase
MSGGGHPGSNLPGRYHEDDENLIVGSQIDEGAARPRDQRASGYRMDMESETFVVASPDRASDGHHGYSSGRGDGADNLIAQTVNSSYAKTTASAGSHGSGAPVNVVHGPMGVRRLTPLECERLQGWADDWTRYTADGKEIPDSHRYRCIGNGVVAPVAEWLGHRLVEADAWP